jgi:hypothetical protein
MKHLWNELKGWLLLPAVLLIDWLFGHDVEG